MEKLMKNKWVIIGLAAIAIYIVVQNIVIPLLPKKKIVGEVIDMPGMENTSQTTSLANHAIKATDIKSLFWIDIPQRNPFSSKLKVKTNEIRVLRENHQAIVSQEQKTTADTEIVAKIPVIQSQPAPKLSGLIAGKQSKLAIVNQRILAEGDIVDGYEVIQIMPNQVVIKDTKSSNSLVLTLENN
jgi:hypothetical protein